MIAIFHIVRIITHQITSQWGLHAQWSMKVARQKRSEICAVRVAKSKKNDLFWEHFFPDQKATKHWKGCHFFQHVDAPTRAYILFGELQSRAWTEILLWDPSQRSSLEISYREISSCRDLVQRSCQDTSFGDLVQRHCIEICCRDLSKRSLA